MDTTPHNVTGVELRAQRARVCPAARSGSCELGGTAVERSDIDLLRDLFTASFYDRWQQEEIAKIKQYVGLVRQFIDERREVPDAPPA